MSEPTDAELLTLALRAQQAGRSDEAAALCRQVLAEFGAPSLPVASRTVSGQTAKWTVGELLPHAFTKSFF